MTHLDHLEIEDREKLAAEQACQAKKLDSSSQEELKRDESAAESQPKEQEELNSAPEECAMKEQEDHHKTEGGQLCEAAKKEQAALASLESPDQKLQVIIEKMNEDT